ncbi:MAG: MFS transporter [Cytophagia bacterium]|nr:MAG: MFS transporter [Cytophagales bacterium]TAG41225.1 MAG: MFS transporter [Cytophagia bacterium]TAG82910.1 MAG: MFS transporter [Cytophagales bacterium]
MKKPFYGWWVLLGLCFIYAGSNGFGINTISPLFLPAAAKEYNWNVADVQKAPFLMFVIIAILAPLVGYALDRFSAKRLMLFGGIGIAASFLSFPYITTLSGLNAYYVGYSVALAFGGIVTSMYILRQWFSKKLGLAIGLFLNSSSFGGAIFAPVAGYLIKNEGWRTAMTLMSVVVGVLFIVVPQFLLKNRPSDLGTYPDGLLPQTDILASNNPKSGVTLPEALRSFQFYLLLIITAGLWFAFTGFLTNQGFYFKDMGLDAFETGKISAVYLTFAVLGKIAFGYLGDRFDKKRILLISIFNFTLGVVILKLSLQNHDLIVPFAVLYGLGYSGVFTMIQVLVAEYYQGPHYGSILGVVIMIDTLAGAFGIITLGQIRKSAGSYDPAFTLMLGLCVAACVAAFFIKKPKVQISNNK